jgi:hypothetical protein
MPKARRSSFGSVVAARSGGEERIGEQCEQSARAVLAERQRSVLGVACLGLGASGVPRSRVGRHLLQASSCAATASRARTTTPPAHIAADIRISAISDRRGHVVLTTDLSHAIDRTGVVSD